MTPVQAITLAMEAGVRFFQYRSKSSPRREIYEVCLELATLARNAGALFVVNDYADIALAVDAAGVHLGQDDVPVQDARKVMGRDRIIGISTHSKEQALDAEGAGADYIGFGPIFETATKNAGPTQGTSAITAIKKKVALPLIAIGGINHANVRDAIRAGADGVAVISAILSAPDFGGAASEMVGLLSEAGKG